MTRASTKGGITELPRRWRSVPKFSPAPCWKSLVATREPVPVGLRAVDAMSPYHRYGRFVLARPATRSSLRSPRLRIPSPLVSSVAVAPGRTAFAAPVGGHAWLSNSPLRRSTWSEPAGRSEAADRFGHTVKSTHLANGEIGAASPRTRISRASSCASDAWSGHVEHAADIRMRLAQARRLGCPMAPGLHSAAGGVVVLSMAGSPRAPYFPANTSLADAWAIN